MPEKKQDAPKPDKASFLTDLRNQIFPFSPNEAKLIEQITKIKAEILRYAEKNLTLEEGEYTTRFTTTHKNRAQVVNTLLAILNEEDKTALSKLQKLHAQLNAPDFQLLLGAKDSHFRSFFGRVSLLTVQKKINQIIDLPATYTQRLMNEETYLALTTEEKIKIYHDCKSLFAYIVVKYHGVENFTPFQIEDETIDAAKLTSIYQHFLDINAPAPNLSLMRAPSIEKVFPGAHPESLTLSKEEAYQLADNDIAAIEDYLITNYPDKFQNVTAEAPFFLVPLGWYRCLEMDLNQQQQSSQSEEYLSSRVRFSTDMLILLQRSPAPIIVGIMCVGNNHFVPYWIYQAPDKSLQIRTVNPSASSFPKTKRDKTGIQDSKIKECLKTETLFHALFPKSVFFFEDLDIPQQLRAHDCGIQAAQTLEDVITSFQTDEAILTIDKQGELQVHPEYFTVNGQSYKHLEESSQSFYYAPAFAELLLTVRSRWHALLKEFSTIRRFSRPSNFTFMTIFEKSDIFAEDYSFSDNIEHQIHHDATSTAFSEILIDLLKEETLLHTLQEHYGQYLALPEIQNTSFYQSSFEKLSALNMSDAQATRAIHHVILMHLRKNIPAIIHQLFKKNIASLFSKNQYQFDANLVAAFFQEFPRVTHEWKSLSTQEQEKTTQILQQASENFVIETLSIITKNQLIIDTPNLKTFLQKFEGDSITTAWHNRERTELGKKINSAIYPFIQKTIFQLMAERIVAFWIKNFISQDQNCLSPTYLEEVLPQVKKDLTEYESKIVKDVIKDSTKLHKKAITLLYETLYEKILPLILPENEAPSSVSALLQQLKNHPLLPEWQMFFDKDNALTPLAQDFIQRYEEKMDRHLHLIAFLNQSLLQLMENLNFVANHIALLGELSETGHARLQKALLILPKLYAPEPPVPQNFYAFISQEMAPLWSETLLPLLTEILTLDNSDTAQKNKISPAYLCMLIVGIPSHISSPWEDSQTEAIHSLLRKKFAAISQSPEILITRPIGKPLKEVPPYEYGKKHTTTDLVSFSLLSLYHRAMDIFSELKRLRRKKESHISPRDAKPFVKIYEETTDPDEKALAWQLANSDIFTYPKKITDRPPLSLHSILDYIEPYKNPANEKKTLFLFNQSVNAEKKVILGNLEKVISDITERHVHTYPIFLDHRDLRHFYDALAGVEKIHPVTPLGNLIRTLWLALADYQDHRWFLSFLSEEVKKAIPAEIYPYFYFETIALPATILQNGHERFIFDEPREQLVVLVLPEKPSGHLVNYTWIVDEFKKTGEWRHPYTETVLTEEILTSLRTQSTGFAEQFKVLTTHAPTSTEPEVTEEQRRIGGGFY